MSKLDDILDPMDWGYEYAMSDYATSREQEARMEKDGLEAIEEAKQQIKDLFLELIGEDDTHRIDMNGGNLENFEYGKATGANGLRSELRQKVSEL